jgi:hypothetical protein
MVPGSFPVRICCEDLKGHPGILLGRTFTQSEIQCKARFRVRDEDGDSRVAPPYRRETRPGLRPDLASRLRGGCSSNMLA